MRAPSVAPGGAQQKDNMCGPFWAARVLVEAGFSEWALEPIDEDLVASRAGTTLPEPGGAPSVPPGANSLTTYRYELPVAPAAESGTSPAGLIQAIESLSDGGLRCVPIRGRWTADRVERLVDQAAALSARLLANVRTGCLWGSRPEPEVLMGELAGRAVQGPPPDWDAGHFVELAMLIRGPKNALVAVRDSYPTLGWNGHHLQPPRVVAAALLRGDGRQGGVLAIVPRYKTDSAAALVAELGLQVGTWNNGSRS